MRRVGEYLTAGTGGEKVPDRSEFTEYFIDGINGDADHGSRGIVTGSDLGRWIKKKVAKQGIQTPQFGPVLDPRSNKGDFLFLVPSELAQTALTELPYGAGNVAEEKVLPSNSLDVAHTPDVTKQSGEVVALQNTTPGPTASEVTKRVYSELDGPRLLTTDQLPTS
jgi:hypothetical protein